AGVQGQAAVAPLVTSRAGRGSCHRRQTIVEPELTPGRLKGAWAAVEGMPRAVETGEQIAKDLGMRPFRIATKSKPIYHAGAVFASNYLVVVEGVAQRLLRHAGLSDADAWAAIARFTVTLRSMIVRRWPEFSTISIRRTKPSRLAIQIVAAE